MGTARQLIPTFVDAQPLYWDRSYVKNMRSIRGYPNYWRIFDTESYIDGPTTQGGQYSKDLYLWRAEILKDVSFDFTDTIKVVNLGDYLTVTQSEVDGTTEYRYKYDSGIESFQYQHTDTVDSVSLEFDQSGRRLIAFEATGNVYFLRFDTLSGTEVLDNFGAGYTPVVVTDTYTRTGGSASSERLLFYVDDATKQIVYRKQLDRYQTVYTLPNAPSDGVEILKISKNLYGGLTVLYCYDNAGTGLGGGSLVTSSFTARASVDGVNIGTDGTLVSSQTVVPSTGSITGFVLKEAIISVGEQSSSGSLTQGTGLITNFEIRSSILNLNEQTDSASLVNNTGASVTNFELKDSIVNLEEQTDSASLVNSTGASVTNFELKVTLIQLSSEAEQSTLTPSTGSISVFTLG
jgi:hypothetical protein